ncbi:hypothetical protein WJX81_001675 [Elliptochloris bilobata]|uniref:G-patch domain-containing protein n=1 Tax=Elliptochloris bilobata TaxID=381761 RepID=A0AAW1SH55_9CHLO
MAADEAGSASGGAYANGAAQANGGALAPATNGGSGFSLSFSAAGARKRPAPAGKRVIPRLENTFRVSSSAGSRKFDPSRFLPEHMDDALGADADRFELAAPEAAVEVTYGLQMRAAPRNGDTGAGLSGAGGGSVPAAALGRFQNTREWEAAKLRDDVTRLPDVASLDAYEAMPVEAFGEAMMRGMGWQEGKGVGRNPDKVVEAVEFVARPPQLGLGATPSLAPKKEKRVIRQGETRGPKPDLVYINAEGVQKNVKTLDAKLVQREVKGAAAGKTMRIVAGTHAGLLCEVLAVEPKVADRSQRATVRLQPSDQAVSVRVRELGERWESPAEPDDAAAPGSSRGDGGRGRCGSAAEAEADGGVASGSKRKHKEKHKRREREKERGGSEERKRSRAEEGFRDAPAREADAAPRAPSWLAPHILVKVIDKHLCGGRLYLRKAEVVDVPAPTRCALLLPDTGETVADVHEDQVETVVPRELGARVLVVAGPHRGQRAWLLSRSGAAGVAAVQLAAELDVMRLGFDQISHFVGEAGEDE